MHTTTTTKTKKSNTLKDLQQASTTPPSLQHKSCEKGSPKSTLSKRQQRLSPVVAGSVHCRPDLGFPPKRARLSRVQSNCSDKDMTCETRPLSGVAIK